MQNDIYNAVSEAVMRLRSNKLLAVIIAGLAIFVILFFILLANGEKKQGKAPGESDTTQITPYAKRTDSSGNFASPNSPAKVSFGSYENRAPLPSLPAQVNAYTLQTNFSLDYVLALGKKLGLSEFKTPNDRYVIIYNFSDPADMGELTFDKLTGSFFFRSYGTHTAPNLPNVSNPIVTAVSFLNYLGLTDDTIICPVTYSKKTKPDVIFVECHRDWQKTGLPILNSVGVLNIPQETKLTDVKPGFTTAAMDDSVIVNTSTKQDGKARPNDFNTATVGVSTDGRIVSIDSNIRPIKDMTTYFSGDLLAPQEALNQFMSHNSQFSLTIPAGSGLPSLQKVYQGDKLQGQNAIITDYLLTYVENPPEIAQNRLVPMYLIRGTAQLSSGFNVRFTEMVPALKNGLTFISPASVSGSASEGVDSITPPGVSPSGAKSLKLGSFVVLSPTPPPTEFGRSNLCPNTNWSGGGGTHANKEITIDVQGLGKLIIGTYANEAHPDTSGHIFWYKCSTFPVKDIEEVRNLFFEGPITNQYLISLSRWLNNNPGVSPAQYTNVEDMYKLFLQINGRATCDAGLAPPVPNCEEEAGHPGFYNKKRINSVSENVAKKIISLNARSELSSWANRPDIFLKRILPELSAIFMDFDPQVNNDSHYISGESPSLYFYPEQTENISVNLRAPFTYTDPSYKTSWHIQVRSGGDLISLSNLLPYRRLYYEYDKEKVSFTNPKEGFLVKKDNWEQDIKSLASTLGLNTAETNDLIFDIGNIVRNQIGTQYFKVSLIKTTEINQKLPLTITPIPDHIYRIHFLVSSIDEFIEIPRPDIKPLERHGFTAVEIGVSAIK